MDAMTPADDLDAAGQADETPPTTMDLELDPPVTFAKKEFTVLRLQEPTGGQAERAEQELPAFKIGENPSPVQLRRYQMRLIAGVAKVPIEVVQQMRVSQIEEAADFLATIQGRGRSTGET